MPNIDEIFKAGLGQHHVDPDASVWSELSKSLGSKEGKVVLPWYYNPKKALIGALVISLFSFSVGFLYAQLTKKASPTSNELVLNNTRQNKSKQLTKTFEKFQLEAPRIEGVNNLQKQTLANSNSSKVAQNSLNNREQESKSKNSSFFTIAKENARSAFTFSERSSLNAVPQLTALLLNGGERAIITDGLNASNFNNAIPTFELDKNLARKKNFIYLTSTEFNSVNANSQSFTKGVSVDVSVNEEATYSSSSLAFGFGKMLSKNIGFVAGFGVDKNELRISGIRRDYDNAEESNLDPRDALSEMSYIRNYGSQSLFMPLGLRFAGMSKYIGYRADFGTFANYKLNENRSFTVSDAVWLPLANGWESSLFVNGPKYGLYSSIGLEAYLGNNLGISLDAIIRKRFQPVILSGEFEKELVSKGFQLGLFYRF